MGLNDLIRVVFVKTPRRYFKDMLSTLNQTLIDGKLFFSYIVIIALLRYLMVLSSLGAQLNVPCDFFFSNPILLAHDIQDIIVFFSPTDRDGNELGLSKEECQQNCEALISFLQYMREDD